MACRGSGEISPDAARWPLVSEFPCLGHILQDDGGIRACYTHTRTQMWKAFWGNSGSRVMRDAPIGTKCDLLDRCCRSVLSYRCSRWPPQSQIAQELDRVQSKMMAAILRIPRRPAEQAADYCHRRNREARARCSEIGPWSAHWFARAIDWEDHIARAHQPLCLSVLLRSFHDGQWLDEQRISRNLQGTGTRIAPGRPCMRWHDGIEHARQFFAGELG